MNNFFVFKISAGISISFAWIPTYIAAWYFGPVIGMFIGFVIDSINFLISGGVWFWLYAIQEPLLGLIVGLIASIYMYFSKNNQSLIWMFFFNQLIIFSFIIFSVFIVFYYTSINNIFFQDIINSKPTETVEIIKKTNAILRWVILGVLAVYLITIEIFVILKFVQHKHEYGLKFEWIQTFLVISAICMITTVIFSFLLGPLSAIEYYRWVYHKEPPNLVQFGVVYYLVPRVIKECFKTPIYIILLATIVFSSQPIINTIKNKIANSYN